MGKNDECGNAGVLTGKKQEFLWGVTHFTMLQRNRVNHKWSQRV